MTRAQWQAIADATHAVLEAAIRYEGSTLGDGTYRNALNQEGGYQNHHRVYDKAGQTCPRCGNGGQIVRIVQAQRSNVLLSGVPENAIGIATRLPRLGPIIPMGESSRT